MRRLIIAVGLVVWAAPASAMERRCGWLQNPTPANVWLQDRDRAWTIAEQGGHQAPGYDSLPDMRRAGWVAAPNGGYGYGCACMLAEVDPASSRVTHLTSLEPIPLSRCRNDPRLR